MAITKNKTKYINHRRKLIIEERELIYQRDKLNKQLRQVRESLQSWDSWLIKQK